MKDEEDLEKIVNPQEIGMQKQKLIDSGRDFRKYLITQAKNLPRRLGNRMVYNFIGYPIELAIASISIPFSTAIGGLTGSISGFFGSFTIPNTVKCSPKDAERIYKEIMKTKGGFDRVAVIAFEASRAATKYTMVGVVGYTLLDLAYSKMTGDHLPIGLIDIADSSKEGLELIDPVNDTIDQGIENFVDNTAPFDAESVADSLTKVYLLPDPELVEQKDALINRTFHTVYEYGFNAVHEAVDIVSEFKILLYITNGVSLFNVFKKTTPQQANSHTKESTG